MKKLTKKQRHEIYKEALTAINNGYEYICVFIEIEKGFNIDYFKEFNLFKPSLNETEFIGDSWFDESCNIGEFYGNRHTLKEGKLQRELALMFCIEMTR